MSAEFWFVIYVFVVYRLSEFVSSDLITESFRKWLGRRAAAGRVWKFFADLINCPLCIGVWLSFPAAFLFGYSLFGWTQPEYFVTGWLGMAGMQYFLSSLLLEKN